MAAMAAREEVKLTGKRITSKLTGPRRGGTTRTPAFPPSPAEDFLPLRLATLGPFAIKKVPNSLEYLHQFPALIKDIGLRLQRWSGMGSPLQWKTAEDQTGTRQLSGASHHLHRTPAALLHNPPGVAGVLDRVLRLRLNHNRRRRHPLC